MPSPLRAPFEKIVPIGRTQIALGTCRHCYRGVWLVDMIEYLSGNIEGRCQGCKDKQEKSFNG